MFEEESKYNDNRQRTNFVFLGFPYKAPIPLDDYRASLRSLESTLPVRFWYFLEEYTTDELMRKLWRAILRADICIFDVSGGNPNVSLELGLAIARFKRCSAIIKTGAENPLGRSDMSYAELLEYSSSETLKDTIVRILKGKSTAMTTIRQSSEYLYDSSIHKSVDEVEIRITKIVAEVFKHGKITKQRAEELVGNRKFADVAMRHLREKQVLAIEGAKRGAKWVFGENWVKKSHQISDRF